MKKTLFAIMALALLTACQTKESAISDLRTVTQELEMNSQTYTLHDWKQMGKKYYKANKHVSKHAGKYTDAETAEISELNGRCVRAFGEGAVTKAQGLKSMLNSFMKGVMRGEE